MKSYIIVAIAFFACASISAEACSLAPIFISVDGHGHAKSYFGSRSGFTVSWKDAGDPADHVTVKDLKSGKSCDLPGWPIRPEEMYLSDDGSTFVLVDGVDDDDAKFYRLDTCEQAGHAHLTAEPHQYFVAPTMVGTYGYCDGLKNPDGFHCYPAAIYTIGDDCMPHYDADKSAALTKTVFGVAFTKTSRVLNLGSAKASATPDADASDLPAPDIAPPR